MLREEVAQAEERIARFKELHLGALPELTQLNLQTLERIERDAQSVQESIRGLVERRAFLEGQLATVTPQRTLVTPDGGTILPPDDELRALQSKYVALSATHSAKHPDVVRLREQIAALQSALAGAQAYVLRLEHVAGTRFLGIEHAMPQLDRPGHHRFPTRPIHS